MGTDLPVPGIAEPETRFMPWRFECLVLAGDHTQQTTQVPRLTPRIEITGMARANR